MNIKFTIYLFNYLHNSMVQNIIWKTDCHSAYQNIFCFLYETQRFISVFTKAHSIQKSFLYTVTQPL